MIALEERGRCPVCRARLRASPECSRCGAALGLLIALERRAAHFRADARGHWERGAYWAAREAAGEAQKLCRTAEGELLGTLADVFLLLDEAPRRG